MITLFVMILRPVNLQYPFPVQMFPMPPPMPVPVPIPGPVQIAVLPIPYPVTEETTTTSRTTNKKVVTIAFPIPMPFMPFMPSPCMKNRSCPSLPMPLPPFPMPGSIFPLPIGPPPAILLPFPGIPKKKDEESSESSSDISSSECGSERKIYRRTGTDHDHDHNHRHRHHRPIRKLSRRRIRLNGRKFGRESGSNNYIKPMLSYISKHGKVKLTRRLTADDAEMLLDSGSKSDELSQDPTMEEFSRKDSEVMSDKKQSTFDNRRNRRVMLRGIDDTVLLNQGRKELVFKPKNNKAISNLSVSFLVN